MTLPEEKMFIDGAWVEGGAGWTETVDPATNKAFARVASASEEDAKRAVGAARAAFKDPEWRQMDPTERGRLLRKLAGIIQENAKSLAKEESQDNGKTFREAMGDILFAAQTFEYYAGVADKIEGEVIPVPGPRFNYTRREPLGVTVHIVPWNYPFQLMCRSVSAALAAGNTAVIKPASNTPISALRFAKFVEEAGFPKGVVNVVTGSGSKLGPVLSGHPHVDGVILTGSVPTGQAVLAEAAKQITPVTLELGGKGPNIVLEDADLKAAAKGAIFGIFMNAGQMCWAGSRLLVHESVHDELLENIKSYMEAKWKVGPGTDRDARMGPLVSKEQLETVMEYVEIGKKEGATLFMGGKRPEDPELQNGNFLEPTVFTDVTPKMRIAQEEIFGPVLSVIKFATDDEALEIANGVDFGLFGGVWTNNLKKAHRFAAELECGMVAVNEYPVAFPQSPFTGFKASGIGSEQGLSAMEFYTRRKSVIMNLG